MNDFKKREQDIIEIYDFLLSITDEAFYAKVSSEKWSPVEIVGHLIDSCTNNHQRIIRAKLDQTPTFSSYNQDEWVKVQNYQNAKKIVIIEHWKNFNLLLNHVMSQVKLDQIEVILEFKEGQKMSYQTIIEDYYSHMNYHINQIKNLIA